MKKLFAQIHKELIQLLRDRLSLVLALILPPILLTILSTALALNIRHLPINIEDLDNTSLSREYAYSFANSITFQASTLPSYANKESLLRAGKVRAILTIPPDFDQKILQGQTADVQVLIDAADSNTANGIRGSVNAITQAFSESVLGVPKPKINTAIQIWYNPGGLESLFYGPGGMAAILAMFPGLLSALAAAKEGDRNTILQVYVSGVSAHTYLLGKILAYTCVAFLQYSICCLILVTVFDLRFAGNPSLLIVAAIIYLFTISSFGIMVGTLITNEATAVQMVQIGGFVFSFLFSGYLVPITTMPSSIRWISATVPARYFIEISRDAFLRGAGWVALWTYLPAIAFIGLVYYTIAFASIHRMQVRA